MMDKLKENKKLIATIIVCLAAAFGAYVSTTESTTDDAVSDGINAAIEKFDIDDMASGNDE